MNLVSSGPSTRQLTKLGGMLIRIIFPACLVVAMAACDREPASTPSADTTPAATPAETQVSRDIAAAPSTTAAVPTTSAGKSQEDLAAAFNASSLTVFETKTSTDLLAIKPLQQLNVTASEKGLKMSANGNDPAFLLPSLSTVDRFIVRLAIDSPAATTLLLLYLVKDTPSYDGSRSQTVSLKRGQNVVYFEVDIPELVQPLRFDLGTSGEYMLQSIAVHNVPRQAPR
ncbi:MAG TPA: hypothetical protein VGW57_09140 [Chthoniobacterales bacterium]|nr:hypothetical protein [Chthoniobacterales bacterium]